MPKYSHKQRKERRRVLRRMEVSISTFNIMGKPIGSSKLKKVAKIKYNQRMPMPK